jgi:hypothetical protein
MVTYPTADQIAELIHQNDGSEHTLQYCKTGHEVYELYFGQGAYFETELTSVFNLVPELDYCTGLNPIYVHLTQAGLEKVLADQCWVWSSEEE